MGSDHHHGEGQGLARLQAELAELREQCQRLRWQNVEMARKYSDQADMRRTLEEKSRELEQTKGQLERRVEERTRDLSAENENLCRQVAQRCEAETRLREFSQEQARLLQEASQARDQLQNSEQWYRTAFHHSGTAMMVLESDGAVTMVNRRFEKLSGYTRQEIEGKKQWTEFVDADDIPRLWSYQRAQQEGRASPSRYEFLFLNRQGNHRYVLAIVRPIPDTDKYLASLLDISERKLAEDALRAHERRLVQIIDFLPDPTWVVDEAGKVVAWNRAMEALSGVKAEEMLGKGDYEYSLPLYGQRCPCLIDMVGRGLTPETRAGEAYLRLEEYGDRMVSESFHPYLRPEGVYLWGTAHALRDAQGWRVGAIESLRDITDQKRGQEELRLNEARLEALVSLGQMHQAPLQQIFDFALEQGVRLTESEVGYLGFLNEDESEMTIMARSTGAMEQCAMADKPASYRVDQIGLWGESVRQRQAVITNDYPGMAKRRGYPPGHIPILRHLNVPIISGERIVVVVGVGNKVRPYNESDVRQLTLLMDAMWKIVQRRQDEEALRASEERYQGLVDALPDPVVGYDNDGLTTYVNPAFTKVFGWTLEELIGKRIDYVPSEYVPQIQTLISKVRKGKNVVNAETRRLTKQGRDLDISLSVAAFNDRQGTPRGSAVILRDVTEQRRLQTQLQHAQKMQAVGTLAGGVAHEFNNLLQVISGYLEFMLLRKHADDPDYNYLGRMRGTVERAKELVRELLTFSRKVESKPRPVDLNQHVAHICRLLEQTIPKMIKLELDLDSQLSGVYADPAQLEQILMNLASNARDAMPEGGQILFQTRNVALDSSYARAYPEARVGSYVRLSVCDKGMGMDHETIKHIFEPFFTTKGPGRGTGLGLSIVYGIVSAHGGHLTCESEPGQGATFHVFLPAFGLEQEEEAEAGEDALPKGGSGTILLVDDEPGIVEMGCEILGTYGFRTLSAASGEQALEVFSRHRDQIDLVILDLNMPGMGGHKCLQGLQALEPEIKVLVSTGYQSEETAAEILQQGAVGFLGKPYSFKDILGKVREVLG